MILKIASTVEFFKKRSPLTSSMEVPSVNTTVEPLISFTFGLRVTDPDKIFKGRSSLITGIFLKSLTKEATSSAK